MNFLPLPTDNLYKFCALVGIVIVGTAIYWEQGLLENVHERAVSLNLELDKAGVELEYSQDLTKVLRRTLDNTQAKRSAEDSLKEGKVLVNITEADLLKSADRLRELGRDMQLKGVEMTSAREELERQKQRSTRAIWTGAAYEMIGGLLALYGFWKWYVLQKKQDALLDRQIADLR